MAYTLALQDILRVQIVAVESEQVSVIRVHYQVQTIGAPAATDQDVAFAFDTAQFAQFRALLNNNALYHGISVQKVFPLPITTDVISIGNSGIGSAGASAAPRQTSGLVSWYTALAGRKYRGRSYIPFPAAADVSSLGSPTAGYVTRLGAWAGAVIGLVNIANGGRTATIALVLKHPIFIVPTLMTAFLARPKFATQRRRGDYGRPNTAPF